MAGKFLSPPPWGELPTYRTEHFVPLSPDLFDSINPPAIWVTLSAPDSGEAVTRHLTIRILEAGKRSVSVTTDLDRYSPESSIFIAVAKMIARLQAAQVPLNRALLVDALDQAVKEWVEPF